MARVHDRVEVAIMGAGAAGCLLAARLAAAGKSVVVLETGPAWRLEDLVSSQIWARRLKWGGAPVLRGGADPVGHNMSAGSGLGGAALHHYASWPRLQPADFGMRTEHGRGLDWPIGYDDLRPHYDRVQEEVGISGDAAKEVWRSAGAPYPMPPLETFAQARVLAGGFAKLGMTVAPMPMAITSTEYKGRPACIYDGWCDAGCPIGALANPLVVHLPAAKKAGAQFRTGASVTRVVMAGGRADALAYRDDKGAEHVQPADLIILAGAAVQNARLLLASEVANRSGLVGAYYTMHAFANIHGLFEAETEPAFGVTSGGLISQDDYGKARSGSPAFGSLTWGLAPALKPNDLIGIAMTRPDLFGPALDAFMKRAAKHIGIVNGIAESLPVRANRVELAAERDAYGVPLARIVHTHAPESKALWAHARDRGLKIMEVAGAQERWAGPRPDFAHLSGGTIMGTDPGSSVCDSHGRTHDVPNLFVAGGGLFPTIGAVSPTFTVLALADRTAEEIMRG